MYVDIWINMCISRRLYLRDSSDPLHTSCRLPYLSDPVVLLRYQPGKVTHVAQQCPLHSNNLGGIETESWASGTCPPSSKTLQTIRLILAVKSQFIAFVKKKKINKKLNHASHCVLSLHNTSIYINTNYVYSSIHKYSPFDLYSIQYLYIGR